MLVTHDRHVLDRVTNNVLEIDRGRAYVHVGGYQSWLDARGRAGAAVGGRRDEAAQPGPRRAGVAPAGRAGAHPQAAGADRRRHRARRPLVPRRRPASGDLPLHVETPRLGDQVVELHGVGRRLRRPAGCSAASTWPSTRASGSGSSARTASGKSTLLDVIAGRRTPREGTVVHGSTARIAVYDQRGAALDPAAAGPGGGGGPAPPARLDRRPAARGVLVRGRRPVGARSACSRAASGGGSSCCWRWPRSRTCCCSTSPPTTSTSTRSAPSRTSSTTGRARSSSSATTVPSSSARSPTCSCSTAPARRAAARAATRRGTRDRRSRADRRRPPGAVGHRAADRAAAPPRRRAARPPKAAGGPLAQHAARPAQGGREGRGPPRAAARAGLEARGRRRRGRPTTTPRFDALGDELAACRRSSRRPRSGGSRSARSSRRR